MQVQADIHLFFPTAFGLAGLAYFWLAARVSRAGNGQATAGIGSFMYLLATLELGAAFSYGATAPEVYAVGRTLTFLAAGFIPVVFYRIYRDYTASPPSTGLMVALSVVPAITTVLVLTNPLHDLIWSAIPGAAGPRLVTHYDGTWYSKVHVPFVFGLFAYALVALAGRLPTIARAHRRKVILLIICAALPYAVSVANNVFRLGPIEFPFTAATLILLLPLYWWVSVAQRVHEFSPLAYQTLFDHVRDPIIVLDDAQCVISANRPAQVLLGGSEADLIGRSFPALVPEVAETLEETIDETLRQTVCLREQRYFELNSAPLIGAGGRQQGTVVVCRDVTERKATLKRLADSEQLIRTLVEHSSNGILRFARDSHEPGRYRCTFANRAAERYLDFDDAALIGMPLDKLEVLEPGRLLDRCGGTGEDGPTGRYESEIEIGDGDCWLRLVAEPVGRDFSVTLIDITQRKRNENKMLADALRDPLTGVLNRRGFDQAARECLGRYGAGAVVYLDLDDFKAINDRFGHQAGDALLKAFGHRLGFCLRPEDVLARLGGDEFVIVLPGIGRADVKAVAERLVESASEAYIIHGQEIRCTASVGIAFMPEHGQDLWQLLGAADRAMYNVKARGTDEAADDRPAYVEAAIAS